MEEKINNYYKNNAEKLHKIVDKILLKFGGITYKDYDDFYSLANEVFIDVMRRYDGIQSFDGFLYSCLLNKIKSEITKRNRIKRMADRNSVSIDAQIGEDDSSIGDILCSSFDMETELLNNNNIFYDDKIERYLNGLSKMQRRILEMKMEDTPVSIIKEKLALSDKEYKKHFSQLKSFDSIKTIKTLFSNSCNHIMKEEERPMMTVATQTAEKSKPMQYSIASINKKIENYTIRFDHPLQRESDQWNPSMKGNLVSDILQGNPLPEIVFAEQIINGIPVVWDLDGKQRCTNCYSFANDGFKVSRNIRRWNIRYLAQIKDENGKPVLDENGFPISEYKEFDIRNKKFSQLPTELQEKFLDYTFKCDQYLNCDSEDIAYHIIRYNEGKNMNKAQKGITRIGEEFAGLVKSISAMPFFREKGGYKVSESKNGTLERVVVESVMASKYLDEWKKEQEYICEYLKENATSDDFDDFEDMVTRLESVVTDEVSDMFDSKDSFLWFGLFARFSNIGEDDEKFIEFMAEFSQSLHKKAVNGITYDELCIDKKTGKTRSTKDKYIVIPKMELLEKLMMEYLDINNNVIKELSILEFVKENVNSGITEDDIEQYEEVLDDLTLSVDNSSKLMDKHNRPSLVAIVAYSFENDIDLDDWIVDYFKKNSTYIRNQKENLLHMIQDLNKYTTNKIQMSA